MSYDFNIREELFGATILNLANGKRDYITKDELQKILIYDKFPEDLIFEKDIKKYKFTPLKTMDLDNRFSFADIAYIEVTRVCNLSCIHCLNSSGQKLNDQLTSDEIKKLIIDLADNGLQEIRFTGGEPLVHPNIFEFIKLATSLGIYVSIGTNATLINAEVANKLKESGLKKAIVSIDGTEKAHDMIRGLGNYKKAITGIAYLEKFGIEVRINSVIMKNNMNDIISLAKQLNSKNRSLMIRRFIESGRGEELTNSVLTKKDYEYVKKALSYELNNGNYINGHYLREKTERISNRIKIPIDISDGCKAGKRALIITPDGQIHLCGFLAAQNFPPIDNVRNIKNWQECFKRVNNSACLQKLKDKLATYNDIPEIQPTNCLAYVQNYINRGKL